MRDIVRRLIWTISLICSGSLIVIFGANLTEIMPYQGTGRYTTPESTLFMMIFFPVAFMICAGVWLITTYILNKAGLSDKKKKIPPHP